MHLQLHPAERVQDYTEREWWGSDTWDSLFRRRVREHPDRVSVVDPANRSTFTDGSPGRVTWRQLDEMVDRLAVVLASHGVERGTVVAVQLPNIVELHAVFLAVARLGAVATPFPVQYREHELLQLCALTDAAAVVTATRIGDRANVALVAGLLPRLPQLRHVLAFGSDVPAGVAGLDAAMAAVPHGAAPTPVDLDPNDCVTICWTSGTEATPKGVPRCANDWMVIARAVAEGGGLHAGSVVLNPFPMVNMAGISGVFCTWLDLGLTVVQHQPFDLPVFLAQLVSERVTYTCAPPAILTMLLRNDALLAGVDLSALEVIASGSAPLTPFMVAGWKDRFGVEVVNLFGSNEGITLLSDARSVPDPAERARFFPRFGVEGHEWPVAIASQMRSRLVDIDSGEEIVEAGRTGELRIAGPAVFAGYLPGTAAASPFDADGFLRTGDVFRLTGDRLQFYEYVDRAKDLVIRGGMNISPAEIESLLQGHPAVAESAVVGYPDDVLGERCCAVVVPRDPSMPPSLEDLVAHLHGLGVASYKLPERVLIVDALPRNPVGKVLKRDLKARI